MRLLAGSTGADLEERRKFSDWILDIGDGSIGDTDDEYIKVNIPRDLLIFSSGDPLAAIVKSTYPNLLRNMRDTSFFLRQSYISA
jgi:ATP-dependent DNA helicase PIF1